MEQVGEIERRVDDGVPVTLSDDGASAAWTCLMFGVGQADETLAAHGLTHLVEHLVMGEVRRAAPALNANAHVGLSHTAFTLRGSEEEARGFLASVSEALGDLPVQALEVERRVLAAEAASRPPAWDPLFAARYGVAGPALAGCTELGLRGVDAGRLRDWAASWFTKANAAVWMTTRLDEPLALELGGGTRPQRRGPLVLPGLDLPAAIADASVRPAVSLLGPATHAFDLLLGIAAERARQRLRFAEGLVYDVVADTHRFPGEAAEGRLSVHGEARDGVVAVNALLGILRDLAEHGPTDDELEETRRQYRRHVEDEQERASLLFGITRELLDGRPWRSSDELLALSQAITPASLADLAGEALTSAVAVAADAQGIDLPTLRPGPVRELSGRTYRYRGAARRARGPALILGDEGVSRLDAAGCVVASVPLEECQAAIVLPRDAVELVGRDGTGLDVRPDDLERGDEVVAVLASLLDDDLLVPMLPTQRCIEACAQTSGVRLLSRDASAIAALLDDDETPEEMVEVRRGACVLTDRRLLVTTRLDDGIRELLVVPYAAVARARRVRNAWPPGVRLKTSGGELRLHPATRAGARRLVRELRRRSSDPQLLPAGEVELRRIRSEAPPVAHSLRWRIATSRIVPIVLGAVACVVLALWPPPLTGPSSDIGPAVAAVIGCMLAWLRRLKRGSTWRRTLTSSAAMWQLCIVIVTITAIVAGQSTSPHASPKTSASSVARYMALTAPPHGQAHAMPTPEAAGAIAAALLARREAAIARPVDQRALDQVEGGPAGFNDLAYAHLVDCTCLRAPVTVLNSDRVTGPLAIFGPTRMAYPQSFVATVAATRPDSTSLAFLTVVARASSRAPWRLILSAPVSRPTAELLRPAQHATGQRWRAAQAAGIRSFQTYAATLQRWTDDATPMGSRGTAGEVIVDRTLADVGQPDQDDTSLRGATVDTRYEVMSGVWAAPLATGTTLACGVVGVSTTYSPDRGQKLRQPGWTPWLPGRGSYDQIVENAMRQDCLVVTTSGRVGVLTSSGQPSVSATATVS